MPSDLNLSINFSPASYLLQTQVFSVVSDSSLNKCQKATKVHRAVSQTVCPSSKSEEDYIEKTHYCSPPTLSVLLSFHLPLFLDSPHYFCHALSCLCLPIGLRELWELELQKACKGCYGREKSNTASVQLKYTKNSKGMWHSTPQKWKVITHYQERCFVRRVTLCIQSV